MAVELWIDDGNPWYLSSDIWVVPSDDPNDPPGVPYANVSAYVWARVHNRGTTAVTNATVNYYWADPSTAITPSTAHLIGTSYASLAPGETKDVLCVTPWIPQYVNNGHECLIAEAFAPADPLPPRGPNDPFNVPTVRQVAQKNLSVGNATPRMLHFVHPFLVGGMAGRGEAILIRARRAPMELLKPLAAQLGLRRLPAEATGFDAFGVQPYRCGDAVEETGEREFKLRLGRGRQQGMALVARVPERMKEGTGALFLMEQVAGDEVLGGVAVLILPEQENR